MLIPLLIGGIQTAKSEVIVPANTTLSHDPFTSREVISSSSTASGLDDYTFNEDFNCSTSKTYRNSSTGTEDKTLIWGCINALSDSVGSSSGSSSSTTSTDSSATTNINSLGEGVAASTALTTALTALPQTSKESKLSCGVGTGAYSSKYAIGFGCASKLNERVDVNAGGSYVFGGSKSYGGGTLDSGVLKAGFVFKLGELNKASQISFNDKKIIDKKLSILEKNNKNLKAKNDEIISQNQKLLARLEKLENIALKFQSNLDVISMSK